MNHYACAIIWRFLPSAQKVEFLVLDYRSKDPNTGLWTSWQVKFPGGMGDESPEQTMVREIREETGLQIQVFKRVWQDTVSPEHTKYGFLVNVDDCRGSLRITMLVENDNELKPPYWRPAETLGRTLFSTHQSPYLAACRALGIL